MTDAHRSDIRKKRVKVVKTTKWTRAIKTIIDKFRKQTKKQIIVRSVLCTFAVLCIACAIYGIVVVKPLYEKAQEQVYDILADMDTGSFRRQNNTTVYDKDGNLIGKLGYEHYEYVNITDISDKIQQGYIDVEDRRFKIHRGVDFKALARATITYLKNGGRITQGGSTITQQVIKNNLLSQERSLKRKILEILIAFQLEKEYTKADIMEFYCNSNYYGNNCYGVQGAAEYYFGVDAQSVDWAQAAIIVGTSNSPNRYNPLADYELCMEKKARVLKQIYDAGHMTEEEYQQALEERPEVVKKNDSIGSESYTTSYAVYCAALKLMEKDNFQFRYTFDSEEEYASYREAYSEVYNNAVNDIRDGGYKLETSFDPKIQEQLQTAVDTVLQDETEKQDDGRFDVQGAAVCIDNTTGQVTAIVGGRGTEEAYNRGYQAKRQAGSAIKPLLVYGPGLNEGTIQPFTVYEDKEIDIGGYRPKNSDGIYRGEVTIREALAQSLNTIAAQVFHDTGSQESLAYLDKMKFTSLSFGDAYNMAISLGGFTRGVTVSDMARGYAAIENGGKMRDSSCLTRIVSEKDGTIYEYKDDQGTEIFSEDTAFILQDMMQGVHREEFGTAYGLLSDDQCYAGKTGTTNDEKDAWFSGFSSYYTCTVWVGSDTYRTVRDLSGAGYPLEIWSSFMDGLHSGLEKKEFPVPGTVLLTNGTEDRQVDYTADIYTSRPEGWDYTSSILRTVVAERARQRRIKSEVKEAEQAVVEFEAYQIHDVEDADNFREAYQNVLSLIEAIEDTSLQEDLKERAENKYSVMESSAVSLWEKAAQDEAASRRAEADVANQNSAAEASETAMQISHDNRVYTVELYIEALNGRTVYDQTVENLVSGGQTALSNCQGYDEYDSLSESLSAAVVRARNLPTAEQVRQENEASAAARQQAESDARAYGDLAVPGSSVATYTMP